jgi:outer membrane autotransporter protein
MGTPKAGSWKELARYCDASFGVDPKPGICGTLIFRWLASIAIAVLTLSFVSSPFAAVDSAVITASPSQITEGQTSDFSIRLTTPDQVTTDAVVVVSVSGSATLGVDYEILGNQGTPITLQFGAFFGESTQTITIRALNDSISSEGTEAVTLTISDCTWTEIEGGGVCPSGSSATVSIIDTTPLPIATIVATDPNASSTGPDPGEFSVRLDSPAPSSGIQVSYSVGGTAVPGQDYGALSGSAFIPGGQTSTNLVVNPLAGSQIGDKTVVATLQPGSQYSIGTPSSAQVTILGGTFGLYIESGDDQVASTGQPLQPFVLRVTVDGVTTAGIPIVWTLETGEGTLSSSRTLTDTQGFASSTLTPGGSGELVVSARVEGSSASVVFTSLFNPLSGLPGLTPNERRVGRTVETLCPRLGDISEQRTLTAGEQDLLTQCRTLIESSASNPTAAAQGVAALTPQQASVPRKLMTQVTGAQVDNVVTRMMALRRGVRGVNLDNLTFNLRGQSVSGSALAAALPQSGDTGGGASADDSYQFERWGIFINGNIDWGSKDTTSNEDGFDFTTLGITAGVDYRFADGLVLGLALGYGDTDADIDANRGDVDAKAWSGTLYGTYYATDHFYLEGSATYGWGDYDQTRNISYSLLGETRTAKADFDGNQYALMFGAGYDAIRGAGILDLYGRVRYVQADIDGYRERGAAGLDLDIGSQEATSFLSILGVSYTRSVSTSWAVLVPQGWLEWAHEFDDGDDDISGFFSNDPSRIPFALATDKFDSDYFRLGLGLGAQFGQGRTAFLTYEAAIGMNNYREQNVNLGVRLDF